MQRMIYSRFEEPLPLLTKPTRQDGCDKPTETANLKVTTKWKSDSGSDVEWIEIAFQAAQEEALKEIQRCS